jgi:K+-sensing histidine kinase KdpD
VDDSRFHQIMANLLSNAAKFSRTGGSVEVDASARNSRCRISFEVGRERGNDLPPGAPARKLRGRRGVTRISTMTARNLKSHADAD